MIIVLFFLLISIPLYPAATLVESEQKGAACMVLAPSVAQHIARGVLDNLVDKVMAQEPTSCPVCMSPCAPDNPNVVCYPCNPAVSLNVHPLCQKCIKDCVLKATLSSPVHGIKIICPQCQFPYRYVIQKRILQVLTLDDINHLAHAHKLQVANVDILKNEVAAQGQELRDRETFHKGEVAGMLEGTKKIVAHFQDEVRKVTDERDAVVLARRNESLLWLPIFLGASFGAVYMTVSHLQKHDAHETPIKEAMGDVFAGVGGGMVFGTVIDVTCLSLPYIRKM
ncbi:MAG TPA: hypothetical protein VLG71_03650, partial [Candidatus Limnocylindria bacterium]|nr:hypothetical protein [Candidatus Limnocylindria bacterium]